MVKEEKLKFVNGKIDGTEDECYMGYVNSDGKPHGPGVYTWDDSECYMGLARHDKRHGFGKYIFADGDEYEGEWVEDEMHGQGTLR